jgi:hypothetical protein
MMTPVTILGVLIFFCALAWHEQPARNLEKESLAENLTRPQQRRKP